MQIYIKIWKMFYQYRIEPASLKIQIFIIGRVHTRQLHRGYPIVLPYPRAIVCGLSYSNTSTFLIIQ